MIKLSICIPTYNRSTQLDKLLTELFLYDNLKLNNNWEICISDNNSFDDTERVVKKWQNLFTVNVYYKKNILNIGAERNFKEVINMASGEYINLLGSDDILPVNTISEIINLLYENHDLIFCNIKSFSCDNNDLNDSFAFRVNSELRLNSKDDLLFNFGTELNFISNLFIKKKFYDYDNADRRVTENLHEFGFSYVYVFLSLLPSQLSCLVVPNICVLRREGDYDCWYDHQKYFFFGMGKMLNELSDKNFSKQSLVYAKYANLRRYIGFKTLNIHNFLKGLKYYWNIPFYYIYLLLIIFPFIFYVNKVFKFVFHKLR